MNPIIVTGDITIPDGITLTIGEGCDVRFQENSDDTHGGWDILRSEIIVYGTLIIDGAEANPVSLASTGTAANGWFGIIFSGNTATGTIDYCNISNGVFGINFTACDGPHYGRCTGGSNVVLQDYFINFSILGAYVGMTIYNDTDSSSGIVTGITTTTYPDDTLLIAGGMSGGATNDPGDYFHFSPLGSAPVVSHCLINDVAIGMYFDNESTPTITDCTIINSNTAFSCWMFSSPEITDCNAANLVGASPQAVYATEYCNILLTGCAFSSGMIEIDMDANIRMRDTTVSDASSAIVGREFKGVGAAKILSWCSMAIDNCNVIGLGDRGNGIEWDDNLNVCKVEYSRIGGFGNNVLPRWGTTDPQAGIYHQVGKRFENGIIPYRGTCTGGDNTFLIDSAVNFKNIRAYVGMTVYNSPDGSSGTVVAITSIPSSPATNNTLQTSGMSGGATNDAGDIYYFTPQADYNNIDLGDLGGFSPFRNWPPWYVAQADYSDGRNEFYGVQDPGCLFNIELEQSGPRAPNLYQLEVWAEGNWWLTTNYSVISRYIWDYDDWDQLGGVHWRQDILVAKRTYSVSGRILDNLGDPVEGVRVSADISVQFPGHTVLADITNEDGYYTIYGLLPHGTSYSIVPEKLQYSFTPASQSVAIPVASPSDVTGVDFTAFLPHPSITSVGRKDGADGGDYGLPGRTNWGLRSETTDIIVTGNNFRETPSVLLRPLATGGDTACSNVVWVTSTRLTANVPAGMTAGNYSVVVINPDSQSAVWGDATTPGFTIVPPPAPHVTGIGPNPISSAFSGDLTVSGKNFQSGCNLLIGGYTWPGLTPGGEGTSLRVTYDSGTLSAGTYAVIVANPDEQSSNTDVTLTVNSPPPTITPLPTITPTPGPPTPTPTPIPKYPRIQPGTNATIYTWGETLALRVEMWPDSTNAFHNLGDLYIAVRTPNGTLLFLSKGRWKRSSAAIYKELVIGVYSSLPLGSFKIGGSFPSGTYTIYGVLNTSGTSVFNPKNWRSGLGSTSFTIR